MLLQLRSLRKELSALDEFREQKQATEDLISDLRAQLELERRGASEMVAEAERRGVQEKERLKREMLIKVKETKQVRHTQGDDTFGRSVPSLLHPDWGECFAVPP